MPGPETTSDVEVRVERFDSEAGALLIEKVQGEYVDRYGGPDETVLDPDEFAEPNGTFFVVYADSLPVACGGWRSLREPAATAEIKRMYVDPAYRGRGLARRVLALLEESAQAAGHRQLWLETGSRQPEAIALYLSSGYAPIDGYGHYRDAPLARPMGKVLSARLSD